MPPFALLPNVYVPTFAIKVGGSPLEDEIAKRIMQISVSEYAEPSNSFSFQLYAPPELGLVDATNGRLREGQDIEISMGYVGNVQQMITGKISGLTLDFPSSGPPTLQVEGFDALHALTRGTAYRKYGDDNGPSDSDTVSKMVAPLPLQTAIDPTPVRTRPRVQNHVTDFAFLQELAQLNGYLLRVDRGTLYFQRRHPVPSTLQLAWGKTLLTFSPRLSTTGQVQSVVVRGWEPMKKQSFIGRAPQQPAQPPHVSQTGQQNIARGSGGRSEIVITNAPVASAQEAQTLAEAILAQLQQTIISASGSSVGLPEMHVGTVLELSGLGRFNGTYTVTRVTHTISESGYYTTFEVNNAPASAGLVSRFASAFAATSDVFAAPDHRGQGLGTSILVGIVIDNKDKQGLGRVKVTFPALSDEEIGHWARLAVPMAGAQRGMFFLPEVRDEVLVAFEHGDITRPYVLGALWNDKDKPPDTNANGQNNLRFIKSRSGHLVRLDDTNGKEKIEIIDKSGNNNFTIDTANNTITIQAAKDVVIQAPQGKIVLSAQHVEITSTADTKVKAQTTMDVQATTTLTIKGQTVNIN